MTAIKVGQPAKLYLIAHACTRQVPDSDAALWQLNELGQSRPPPSPASVLGRVDRLLLSCEPKTRLTVAPPLEERQIPVAEDARFK